MPKPDTHIPPAASAASRIRESAVVSNHKSMSTVVVFAPWSDAAVSPTIMYFTPRSSSSVRKRRSASVRTKTAKASSQPLVDRTSQVTQHMVDAGRVHAGVFGCNRVGTTPKPLVQYDPISLFFAQISKRIHRTVDLARPRLSPKHDSRSRADDSAQRHGDHDWHGEPEAPRCERGGRPVGCRHAVVGGPAGVDDEQVIEINGVAHVTQETHGLRHGAPARREHEEERDGDVHVDPYGNVHAFAGSRRRGVREKGDVQYEEQRFGEAPSRFEPRDHGGAICSQSPTPQEIPAPEERIANHP